MTDEKTVLLARGGDKAAEDLILKKYLPLVKAVSASGFGIFVRCFSANFQNGNKIIQRGMFCSSAFFYRVYDWE